MFHEQLTGYDLHAPTNQFVENDTGTDIPALKAVTYNGFGPSSFPSIVLADGSTDRVRGITQINVSASGGFGVITGLGFLIGNATIPVDTSLWPPGQVLYADTSGNLVITPIGTPVATVYKSDPVDGIIYVENSFIAGGGGTGNVIGPATSTDKAIARWNGTTGTLIQDSQGTLVQDSGAIQTQAIIVQKSITGVVSVPTNFAMLASGIEIEGGEIDIETDAELVIL